MSKEIPLGLSFDDVLLVPCLSDVLPPEIDLGTLLVRGMPMKIPVLSAAMDTVTEDKLAIGLAREGGVGVIHRNCAVIRQCELVETVKRSEHTVVDKPITVRPETTIRELHQIMREKRISGFPVVDDDGVLKGMVTRRDIRFLEPDGRQVKEVMTPRERLVTAPPNTSLSDAKSILYKHRIEKLPLVDKRGRLTGMMTGKDIEKRMMFQESCKDEYGRLRAGAAVGVGDDAVARAQALAEAGADCLFIDAATGHTRRVVTILTEIRKKVDDVPVVAGNVVTEQGALDLIRAGASAVKVGLGPGSICTTRVVSGVGVPQFTAIQTVARVCRKKRVPLIADGGIRFSGDILKALAAGADSVMIGSLFAGTEESPGSTVIWQGKPFKEYWGMGSIKAMRKGSSDRYGQNASGKLVPEGVEARVPYRGSLGMTVAQLMGGVRSGMGYIGAKNLQTLRERARFVRLTPGGLRESQTHDVVVSEEPVSPMTGAADGE